MDSGAGKERPHGACRADIGGRFFSAQSTTRRTAVEMTEVRIKLIEEAGDRLQAFCSITFDNCFVVRDLKIIEGANGPFVAMPSRKLTSRCVECGCKNHLRASYCNQCGSRQQEDRVIRDEAGRTKLYADIAHPINAACREMIQARVVEEFREELERAKQPDYVCRYEDNDLDEDFEASSEPAASTPAASHDRCAPRSVGGTRTKLEPAQAPRGPHKPPARPGRTAAQSQPGLRCGDLLNRQVSSSAGSTAVML